MAIFATDRALFKINGVDVGTQIISANWDIDNNAKAEPTMTTNRINQVVTLGNISGTANITEAILQGVSLTDWINQDLSNAILEVHPASNSYIAPAQEIQYSGQVQLLQILAFGGYGENYNGAGSAATRSLRFILANATYAG